MRRLDETDPEILRAIENEVGRIQSGVELIPSENFVSLSVMQAMSSVFTNKYSEGYPGRRYYGGNEFVDLIERLAVDRAKALFNAEHVNVQPYSGSPANLAVYYALLEIGDKFMGMDLDAGGHLTHGSPVNFSGRFYEPVSYSVDPETELLDMDEVRKLAEKEKPKMIIASLTSYPRTLPFNEFCEIAKDVNAYSFADISHIAGLIVGGTHPSPLPETDIITTTTHKSLRGPRGAIIMCKKEDPYKDIYHAVTEKNLAQLIDSAVFPGLQGGPHDNITAAKAVSFKEAMQPDFKEYARQVVENAKTLANELMNHGLKLVTDGTDNHLMVIDLRPKGLDGKGKLLQSAMDKAGITVNKNSVPFDDASPFNPSGLRLGTPAVTTRGMKQSEMKVIASCISRVIENYENDGILLKIRDEIQDLVQDFQIYPNFTVLR
ncbi:serine hydroxymethyltransferase [Candidatus Bathyarchaeota archaeon]|nr:serine hydroxymethyltransferase [Candidatus Bathyarchaeota archaeon]